MKTGNIKLRTDHTHQIDFKRFGRGEREQELVKQFENEWKINKSWDSNEKNKLKFQAMWGE